MFRRNRNGALELSIGTIVILVIAMSMLILGLVLVRTIFTESIYNVKQINDKVKSEIQKIFSDDNNKKLVVYLSENKAEIKQGDDWGIAFSFRNLETGTTEGMFSYNVEAVEISRGCQGLTPAQADSWIQLGKTRTGVQVPPGGTHYTVVNLRMPESTPLCSARFDISVYKGSSLTGQIYTTDFFDVVVKPK
ncbi:MAG: hypothetical protein IIA87_03855 [Nanoarchaeota archaeon]|nr:hypothetical protein [Nanoarchaeota archaeon]